MDGAERVTVPSALAWARLLLTVIKPRFAPRRKASVIRGLDGQVALAVVAGQVALIALSSSWLVVTT